METGQSLLAHLVEQPHRPRAFHPRVRRAAVRNLRRVVAVVALCEPTDVAADEPLALAELLALLFSREAGEAGGTNIRVGWIG